LATRPHTGPSSVRTSVPAVHAGAAGAAATAVRDAAPDRATTIAMVTPAIPAAAQRHFFDLLPIRLILIPPHLKVENRGQPARPLLVEAVNGPSNQRRAEELDIGGTNRT
jgi:hypothetical protein